MKHVVLSFAALGWLLIASLPCSAEFIARELLGRPTATSITISACADSAMDVYYQYGTDSTNYTSATDVVACQDSIPFFIMIQNLSANTQYYYRMRYRLQGGGSFLAGAHHSFRTARTDNQPFTFAVEADPHMDTNSSASVYALTLQNILSSNPDFLIDLGDNFFSEKFQPYSLEVILGRHLYLRSFYDIACHSVPLFLVLGNHEGEQGWRLNGTAECLPVWTTNIRKSYFPNPEPDAFYSGDTTHYQYVGRREAYYSWEWGNALFVVLDPYWYPTNNPQADYWRFTLGQTQYDWLARVLSSSHVHFKFIFIHQLVGGHGDNPRGGIEAAPFYEQGGLNADSTWGFDTQRPSWGGVPIHQLIVANGVTALFHGHDHFYCKQDLDGIIYQLVPQPSTINFNNTPAQQYGYVHGTILPSRGYLRISVSDTACTVEYVRTYLPFEENAQQHNGDIADSYTIVRTDSADAVINCLNPLPKQAYLWQNYPNPFNSRTNISFDLGKKEYVRLEVFNAAGQRVQTLIDNELCAGRYNIQFLPRDMGSGTYFSRLKVGNTLETSKMLFLK
jgi:hypothetical protein